MTEHKKSQPRVFDELSSSHQIVHQGDPSALALGMTVVNIADRFASPLCQRQSPPQPLLFKYHRQPRVTQSMIQHLRGLPQTNAANQVGFDAYCTMVVDFDNDIASPVRLYTDQPAPQPGDLDYYNAFLNRVCSAYRGRIHNKVIKKRNHGQTTSDTNSPLALPPRRRRDIS
jgi:hypothetical protein